MQSPTVNQQITFIYTDNLNKSAEFYENIIGLSLWRDQGTCRIYSLTESALLGVCAVGPKSKGKFIPGDQQNIIITLVTDEVDKWYSHLQSKGISFEKPPAINPNYNIYHCFLRDPSGYLIEIQHFLDDTD